MLEASSKDNSKHLNKKLSLVNAWALAFGGVIGWGAFVMPGTTFLKKAGPFGTLVAMEIGAFVMLVISYAYGYMIKKFPVSGGEFIYAEHTFGKRHGFICAWFLGLCYINIIPMNATALSLVFRAVAVDLFKFGFMYTVFGYDVYLGETLLALGALIIFALIASCDIKFAGIIQTVMAMILLVGVIWVSAGSLISPATRTLDFQPIFFPDDRGVLFQIISVAVVAPWAYVGFDTVPQLAEESNFSHNHVKIVMDTSIIIGGFVYIALNFIAISAIPAAYQNWVGYVGDIENFEGVHSILTFSTAYKTMGERGLLLISLSALCAMTTGILCFYVATSRLLYSMAREKLLPSWFGVLNKNNVPSNAVLFCLLLSSFAPFVGRNALGWTVDMSSLGGAVGFGYTSLAAYKYSRQEDRTDITIFGFLGFIFSIMFAILLLVPIKGLNSSLATQSYVLLVFWVILGAVFFLLEKRKSKF